METEENSSQLNTSNHIKEEDSSHLNYLEKKFYDSFIDYKSNISAIQENLDDSMNFISGLNISFISKECENIIFIDKIKSIIFKILESYKSTYFRYIPKNGNNSLNKIFISNNYIPLVKLEEDQILFHDGDKNGKYFNLKELLLLIMNNQLFIENEDINNKGTINQGYICKLHNKNYFQFCEKCKVNICVECSYNHKDHEIIVPDANIAKIMLSLQKIVTKMIQRLEFKFKKNKITNFYSRCVKIIYCFIIKKMIREKFFLDKHNKYNYNIEKNIIDTYHIMKSKELKIRNYDNNTSLYSPILWITEFYSKEQINNNVNKNENIWISLSSDQFVKIYSFELLKNKEKYYLQKDINEINRKKLNTLNSEKIMRLEKVFNPDDKEKNYFLIGSFFKKDLILISVTHNYENIEEVQMISNKGLISSIEINFNNNYFLLQNNNKIFNLWFYDYINDKEGSDSNNNCINDKKGLKYRIITPIKNKQELKTDLINDNNLIIKYNEIISFIKNKNLLIVHHFCSEPFLTFYKIEESENFNIILIGGIKPRENQNKFSIAHNNCSIIDNKYLIIGSQSNKKEKKFGGFYIINLENIQIVYYYQEPKCVYFNSLINLSSNMFICSSRFDINIYGIVKAIFKLILYEFNSIENGKFKIIKKNAITGKFSKISNTSLISDNFLIASNSAINFLIKIKDDKLILCSELRFKNANNNDFSDIGF